MTKQRLKYEAMEDQTTGDLLICISGASPEQKDAIVNNLGVSLTSIGTSFSFIKDTKPTYSVDVVTILNLIQEKKKAEVTDYVKSHLPANGVITKKEAESFDARAFAYAWTRVRPGATNEAYHTLIDNDRLTDDEWLKKVFADGMVTEAREYFSKDNTSKEAPSEHVYNDGKDSFVIDAPADVTPAADVAENGWHKVTSQDEVPFAEDKPVVKSYDEGEAIPSGEAVVVPEDVIDDGPSAEEEYDPFC